MKHETLNTILILIAATSFTYGAYIDFQQERNLHQRVNQLNQSQVYVFDELEHQRDRRQTLAGRVLFLESDLEDVLGPNWTHADSDDNISLTECERVSRVEVDCRIAPEYVRKEGDSK